MVGALRHRLSQSSLPYVLLPHHWVERVVELLQAEAEGGQAPPHELDRQAAGDEEC